MSQGFSDERLDREIKRLMAIDAAHRYGAPSAIEVAQRIGTRRTGQINNRLLLVAALMAMAVLVALAALLLGSGSPQPRPLRDVHNGWIAFSTQPYDEAAGTDTDQGGDIYLVREGVGQVLVASRGDTKASNICPSWSPDGSTLAYGTRDGTERTVVLLAVGDDGSIINRRSLDLPLAAFSPCPRWSKDGSYLAFPLGPGGIPPQDSTSPLTALNLAGQTIAGSLTDLDRSTIPCNRLGVGICALGDLVSPASGYGAYGNDQCQTVITNDIRPAPSFTLGAFRVPGLGAACPYSLGPWSPDGRQLLLSYDIGDFALTLVSVDQPERQTQIAAAGTNGARSWPGRFDISWQSIH